jgi:hypothetical protein
MSSRPVSLFLLALLRSLLTTMVVVALLLLLLLQVIAPHLSGVLLCARPESERFAV